MDIYLDELFIVNVIACLFMLKVYSFIISRELSLKRGLAAAVLGGGIACIRFMYSYLMPISVILEMLIPIVGFGKISWKNILLFFLIKYAFSGLAVLVVSCFGGASALIQNGIIYFNINAKIFIPMLVICAVSSLLMTKLMKIKHNKFYTLIVSMGDKNVKLKALYDSGNMLKNPYDGSGVIITNKSAAEKIGYTNTVLIPFTALGCERGLLKAFKAENVYCVENGKNIKNVTIGISEHILSKNKKIEALMGPEVFKEEF